MRTQDRTQDGTQEDSKGSSDDEKIKRILEFCQTPKGIEQGKYIEQIFFLWACVLLP